MKRKKPFYFGDEFSENFHLEDYEIGSEIHPLQSRFKIELKPKTAKKLNKQSIQNIKKNEENQ